MTGSDDSRGSRPISVAELLAKNGTIGSPPVGGRRRRRRGNADAVSVAELTGEIPIIRVDEPDPSKVTAAADERAAGVEEQPDEADIEAVPAPDGAVDRVEAETGTKPAEGEADNEAGTAAIEGAAESEAEPAEGAAENEADTAAIEGAAENEAETAEGAAENEADTAAIEGAAENEAETDAIEAEAETETDAIEVETETAGPAGKLSAGAGVVDGHVGLGGQPSVHLEQRGVSEDPVAPKPRRFGIGRLFSKKRRVPSEQVEPPEPMEPVIPVERADRVEPPEPADRVEPVDTADPVAADAEHMSPDPPDDGEGVDVLEAPAEVAASDVDDLDKDVLPDAPETPDIAPDAEDTDELPSYLRSTQEPLFGGQTVADDIARGRKRPAPDNADLGDAEDLDEDLDEEDLDAVYSEPRPMSAFVHGLWIVGQSVFAVALGAGLFVAFDQLWKWNNIIALVLSVLVILGLVVAVRVVRKTEDIGSTLIAVAVGALVTLGPLALLQSG